MAVTTLQPRWLSAAITATTATGVRTSRAGGPRRHRRAQGSDLVRATGLVPGLGPAQVSARVLDLGHVLASVSDPALVPAQVSAHDRAGRVEAEVRDPASRADRFSKAANLQRRGPTCPFEGVTTSLMLFTDKTTAPVPDNGRGLTSTGQLFACARDVRLQRAINPPGIACSCFRSKGWAAASPSAGSPASFRSTPRQIPGVSAGCMSVAARAYPHGADLQLTCVKPPINQYLRPSEAKAHQ